MLGITRYQNTAIDSWQGQQELFCCEHKTSCPVDNAFFSQNDQKQHLSFYFSNNTKEQIIPTLTKLKNFIEVIYKAD